MRFRPLFVESLESRRVLAGNVTASIVNGELRIVGDKSANWVEVRQIAGADGTGRTFVVDGKPFNGGYNSAGDPVVGTADTRINGGAQAAVLVTPLDKLRIVMDDGNDVVEVGIANSTATLAGLVVQTGTGRDFVDIERVTMNGTQAPLFVHTGSDAEVQSETVRLRQVAVTSQSMSVVTGGGNDRLLAVNLRSAGAANFNLGSGADTFDGVGVTFNNVAVNTGSSNERDTVHFSGLRATNVSLAMGGGNDFINFRDNVRVTNRATLHGGSGFDTLSSGTGVVVNEVVKISIEETTL